LSSLDLCADEFLWAREAFRMVTDHARGSRPMIGPAWRMSPDPTKVERGAPKIGEDNEYVYREILGLRGDELDDLIARKVVD
jgi:crotonobetainyl-CoA:carnitine CoA-transferase CaiB-like acyl-CoA transferase